jgi:hypothetical protein
MFCCPCPPCDTIVVLTSRRARDVDCGCGRARTPESWEWQKVNVTDPLVQDAVKDALALTAARDAVAPHLKLASCGWVIGPLGARAYFDSVLPLGWSMSSIDMNVGK